MSPYLYYVPFRIQSLLQNYFITLLPKILMERNPRLKLWTYRASVSAVTLEMPLQRIPWICNVQNTPSLNASFDTLGMGLGPILKCHYRLALLTLDAAADGRCGYTLSWIFLVPVYLTIAFNNCFVNRVIKRGTKKTRY